MTINQTYINMAQRIIEHVQHLDSMAMHPALRNDANETLFLARQLESIDSVLYEYKQPELLYRELIPVDNTDNPGAENLTYRMITMVGMAKIIANYSDDLPRADAIIQEFTCKVKSIGASFGYSVQEIRAAIMTNTPLDSIKAAAARRGIREKESNLAWTGDSSYGIVGFLNNPNIPTLAAAAGTGGTVWSLKTADEIIKDFTDGISLIRTQSKGIHKANTAALPLEQYTLLATKRLTDTDKTLLSYILENQAAFGLSMIIPLPYELDLAFVGGTADGMILYERDPEVLVNKIPLEMITHPMQQKNLEYTIPVEARNGGVVVRYPLACLYFTGI